jgi:hypothetical protein
MHACTQLWTRKRGANGSAPASLSLDRRLRGQRGSAWPTQPGIPSGFACSTWAGLSRTSAPGRKAAGTRARATPTWSTHSSHPGNSHATKYPPCCLRSSGSVRVCCARARASLCEHVPALRAVRARARVCECHGSVGYRCTRSAGPACVRRPRRDAAAVRPSSSRGGTCYSTYAPLATRAHRHAFRPRPPSRPTLTRTRRRAAAH